MPLPTHHDPASAPRLVHIPWLPVVLLLAVALACGSSSSTPVGGTCSLNGDCSGGLCLKSTDFPSGYCSQSCDVNNASSCPQGSVCIDDASGAPADAGISAVCYQSCTTATGCGQAGFSCLEKSNHLVCRKP